MVVKAQPSAGGLATARRRRRMSDLLPGSSFDPQRILARALRRRRSIRLLRRSASPRRPSGRRAPASSISPKGYVLTNSHVITNAQANRRRSRPRSISTSSSRTATGSRPDRSAGTLYDDVGSRPRRPGGPPADTLVPLGRFRARRRRRARGGDRKPARERELAHRRRRLWRSQRSIGAITVQSTNGDRRDPDRRPDHPRQLRRAFARRTRPRDRDQRADSQHRTAMGTTAGSASRSRSTPRRTRCAQLIARRQRDVRVRRDQHREHDPSLARVLGYKTQHGALIVDVKRRKSRAEGRPRGGAPGGRRPRPHW